MEIGCLTADLIHYFDDNRNVWVTARIGRNGEIINREKIGCVPWMCSDCWGKRRMTECPCCVMTMCSLCWKDLHRLGQRNEEPDRCPECKNELFVWKDGCRVPKKDV